MAKWKNWRDMIIESPWAHCKYRITKLLSCWLREQIPWVSRSWLVADSKVTKACYLSRSPKFVLKLHGTHEETEIWSFNCFWMALGQALHVVLAPGVWSWGIWRIATGERYLKREAAMTATYCHSLSAKVSRCDRNIGGLTWHWSIKTGSGENITRVRAVSEEASVRVELAPARSSVQSFSKNVALPSPVWKMWQILG